MSRMRVLIIGGGAAGLMAAGQAALQGAAVEILEKKPRPGLKLSITGKGRCNLTNNAPLAEFLARFPAGNKFLRQAFARFFSGDLVDFFSELGIVTATERGGRIFPIDNDAGKVVEALNQWIRAVGVKVRTRTSVESIEIKGGQVSGVTLLQAGRSPGKAQRLSADAVIIATGGLSYPATGATGDGYRLAESIGHTVISPRPSLVPIETTGDGAKRLQGLSLRNVMVTLSVDGKNMDERFGEMLFTHFGLSGPVILSLSRQVVEGCQQKKKVSLSIDLKPALDEKKLDQRILRDIEKNGRQQFGTLLKDLLPRKLIPVCSHLTTIDLDKPGNQISSVERKRLVSWLKNFTFEIGGHRGYDDAIITAGGVSTREIDPRTMQSRLVSRLYFAGEVMDIDADTGGYNLQAAFSTGWLAGKSAADRSNKKRRKEE